MQKLEILNRLVKEKIVAIIRVDTIERAVEIVDGNLAGGVSCLEISYTNSNAGSIIEQLSAKYQNQLLIGAGTVLDAETARHAILCGAKFIIAPNFSLEVAKLCNRYQIPYMPGCTSVSEAVIAMEAGADMIKMFPTSSLFGSKIVSTLKTPLPYMPLFSSGGVTIENIKEWVEAGVEVMGVGTLLSKGTQEEIAINAKKLSSKIAK